MKYLGIDFGLRRVGLATSSGQIATPLKVLDYEGREELIEKILKICQDEKVTNIVVGIPERDRIGAEKFARELSTSTYLEVVRYNEDSTTLMAMERIKEAGFKSKRRGERIDHFAASILLQNFLESRNG